MYGESTWLSECQGEEERERNLNPAKYLDVASTPFDSNQIKIVDNHAINKYP
jgi:hypothetical protein